MKICLLCTSYNYYVCTFEFWCVRERAGCLCRCVIGELFTDGRQLFDLSQLLELRARQGEYSPEILLKKISDKPVRVSPLSLLW